MNVAVMLLVVLCRERAHLITISSQSLFTLSDFITSNQVVSFFLNHQFCAGMNTTCWKPRSTVLAPVASLSPKTVSLVRHPLDDQDLLTKRKRVSEELRSLLQIGAIKRKNKIADQLLDWMALDNETNRTLLDDLYNHLYDLSEEQGRIPSNI